MVYAELIELIQKKDASARQKWFESFYERLSPIAHRYAKSAEQAEAMLPQALHNAYEKMHEMPEGNETAVVRQFIAECVNYIRSIRNEYFVASTVHATTAQPERNYNLFDSEERPDPNAVSTDVLINALQKLVPAQRLVFNLHVIDGYSLAEAAALLESSEATLKSNLEKARFTLQKNIETTLKSPKS